MMLVLDSKGAKLSRKGACFCARRLGETKEIAAAAVTKILIGQAVSVTSDALMLAASEGIPVFFLDGQGNPYGAFDSFETAGNARLRRKQALLAQTRAGVELSKYFLCAKIDGRIRLLKKLKAKRSGQKAQTLADAILLQEAYVKNIQAESGENVAAVRDRLQGLEGTAGRAYFGTLSALLPAADSFAGRSFRPAKDRFNAMLNYAYGILYAQVKRAAMLAGLDPYMGVMHADAYNKPAFVFDAVEMFRHYAEETVFLLFSGRKASREMFDERDGGVFLNGEGRRLLIPAYYNKMEEMTGYGKRRVKVETEIELRLSAVAKTILES